jgi:PPOX class probable F420-dependent enzyme
MAEFRFQLSVADSERVRANPIARLATIRPDGTPHLVPITFAFDGEALVTAVDGKPKRTTDLQRLHNIAVHPAVSVLIDRYDDDWTQLWWVRIDGSADVVNDGINHARAIEVLTAKYAQYRDRPPTGPVIRVRPGRVTTWAAR